MDGTLIPTCSIALQYTCADCGAAVSQPLPDIVESGTAVCPNCDTDMELDDVVLVDDFGDLQKN